MVGEVDFRTLALPAIGTKSTGRNLGAFKAVLQVVLLALGKFSMYSFIDGTKRFSIEGGYASNISIRIKHIRLLGLEGDSRGSLFERNSSKMSLDGTGKGYTPRIRDGSRGFDMRTLYRFLAESQWVLSAHQVLMFLSRIIVYCFLDVQV